MKATLIRTQEQVSKFGGKFYYAFFRCEDGRSRRACLYASFGNFKRWQPFIGREGVELDNLITRGTLVDADSYPQEIKEEILR